MKQSIFLVIFLTVQVIQAQNTCNVYSSHFATVVNEFGDSLDYINAGETKELSLPGDLCGFRTINEPVDIVMDCGYFKDLEEWSDSVTHWYHIENVLPAHLVSFTGEISDKIEIKWQTASEQNVSSFTVQLGNGIYFESFYSTRGQNKASTYTATIENLFTEPIIYARLITTDFDGSETFSETIALNNPQDTITGTLRYFDVMGREMTERPRNGFYTACKGHDCRKFYGTNQ